MKKRVFALALAVMLALSLLPMAALAADDEPVPEPTESTGEVAQEPVEESPEEPAKEAVEESNPEPTPESTAEPTSEPVLLALDGTTGTSTVNVANSNDFKSALSGPADEICVTGTFFYFATDVDTQKTITIKSGGKLTVSGESKTVNAKITVEAGGEFCVKPGNSGTITVSGTIVNNGAISTTGTSGYCDWTADITGNGTFTTGSKCHEETSTYFNYGNVPAGVTGDYRINIAKNVSKNATVALPNGLKMGDTATPTFENIADNVDVTHVFTYNWKDKVDNTIYTSANPVLTQAENKLTLTVTTVAPYAFRTSSGGSVSLESNSVTVESNEPEIVYVDETRGNDSNFGNTKEAPLETLNGTYGALNKVKDGGTVILLSDVNPNAAVFNKDITLKSDDGKKYTVTFTGGNAYAFYVVNGKRVTFEDVELKNILFSADNKTPGTVVFKNCSGSGLTIPNGQVNNITFDTSTLDGTFCAGEKLILSNSTLEGSFSTKDFEENGDSTFKPKANTDSVISGNITVNGTVTVVSSKLEKGLRIIQLPNGTDVSTATKFTLSDDENGKYTLKVRSILGGKTYLGISERISSENGKFAVAYEPVIAQPVKDGADYFDSDIRLGNFHIESAVWSGYTNTSEKRWSVDDVPKLTITLSTDNADTSNHESGRRFGHFDSTFKITDLSVYSWQYDTETPLTYTNKNNDVRIILENGQGISDDGMTFTFTICYPAVTRLEQTITGDTSARTSYCKDILDPRAVSAEGTISYESSNPEIASVDAVTGKITAHKEGVVTITVKAAQTDLYKEAQVSYTLEVSHKYSDDFKYDGTGHWKECACGDKSEKAAHTGGTATCTKKAVCDICDEEYGEVNAANHAALKHVETKAATLEAEGNIEYWYCEDCGKYYSDENGKKEIALADTVIAKLTPTATPTAKPAQSPRTGDEANVAVWLALATMSIFGIALVARKKAK